jgi:hypothetical protein
MRTYYSSRSALAAALAVSLARRTSKPPDVRRPVKRAYFKSTRLTYSALSVTLRIGSWV